MGGALFSRQSTRLVFAFIPCQLHFARAADEAAEAAREKARLRKELSRFMAARPGSVNGRCACLAGEAAALIPGLARSHFDDVVASEDEADDATDDHGGPQQWRGGYTPPLADLRWSSHPRRAACPPPRVGHTVRRPRQAGAPGNITITQHGVSLRPSGLGRWPYNARRRCWPCWKTGWPRPWRTLWRTALPTPRRAPRRA